MPPWETLGSLEGCRQSVWLRERSRLVRFTNHGTTSSAFCEKADHASPEAVLPRAPEESASELLQTVASSNFELVCQVLANALASSAQCQTK